MEKIKRVKLSGGANLYFVVNPKYTTSNIQIMFKIGWRNDKTETLGLAHLFEHLVGKRTEKFPAKTEFTKHLEECGIVSNAYTSPDTTCYHHSQTTDKTFESLKLLFEAIYNTKFNEEDLEKEKHVVLTESREYLDNDDSLIWHKMIGNIFPKSTLEKFFFGTEETMKNISMLTFLDFYKIYLNPQNANIFIGINSLKEEKKIIKFINEFYNQKKIFTKNKIEKVTDEVLPVDKKLEISKPEKTQANVRLAYRIPKLNKKERIAFSVMSRILTAGFSARLMKKLRDEEGLIYGVYFYRDIFVGGLSYATFGTACKKENKEKVFEIIKTEVKKLATDVTQKEIENVVPIIEYYEAKGVNVNSDVAAFMDSELYAQEYIPSKEFVKLIKQIKTNDIKALVNKLFKEENEVQVVLE